MKSLEALLADANPVPIIETDARVIVLDLGAGSDVLGVPLAGLSVQRFTDRLHRKMTEAGTGFAFGRWGERRELYTSELFAADDPADRRDIHLGVDVFCRSGTAIHAPLAGRVFLKANNARELDYGPLLILEHEVNHRRFYTLYGHLSLESLDGIEAGQAVQPGEVIARVGEPPENGNWSPHLHFQPILDLKGLDADFPGVCNADERDSWFALSPLPAGFFPECAVGALDGRDVSLHQVTGVAERNPA